MFAEDRPRQSQTSVLDWGHSSVIHDSVPPPALAHSLHAHLHTICVPDTVLGIEEWQRKMARGAQEKDLLASVLDQCFPTCETTRL